jgi:CubicO group peptidase (beta-lactamase class C family)
MTKRLGQGFAAIILLLSLMGQVQSRTPKHAKTEPAVAPSAATPASPTVAPEDVGLSSERLERIASAIQKSVDDGRIAGGVSLVARHGKIAYFKAVGMVDRDAEKPMRTDSLFRICSMSKPLTSVAVMMLYEEGKFNLNQPVSDFLPEFKNMKVLDPSWPQDRTSPPGALVDAKRPITIFHLLTHTSGLTYGGARLGKAYREGGVTTGLIQQEGTIADGVKRLAKQPLLFQPGDVWEYSLADDVLGRLVEVASGMPFDQFLEERLFKPLGMKDTGFFPPEEKVARLATAYTYYEGKGLQPILDGQVMKDEAFDAGYSADYPCRGPKTYFSGGAGLCSTAEDYYRFCQMMLNGGALDGTRILSRKSVELMSQNHLQGKLDTFGYGLGFGVTSELKHLTELGSVGSYYWGGFYYTSFVIDPKEDLIAIFMGQLHPTGGLNLDSKAINLAYQAIQD